MSPRNGVLITIVSWLLSCALGWSGQPDDSPTTQAGPRSGVLVFRNGRVIEGQITETDTHYVVVRPVGKIEVPKGEIERVAKDLDDAYRQKVHRLNDRDPDEHLRLAEWCLKVNLQAQAIEQLERAVDLAPDRGRAQALLDSLRRTQPRKTQATKDNAPEARRPANAPASPNAPKKTTKPADMRQPAQGQSDKDSELVPVQNAAQAARTKAAAQVQLAPSLVSTFTLRVQPLLVRSCAAAGCHDASHAGTLALDRSLPTTARATQQNLRTVLSLIDSNEPENSPLVLQSLLPHGGSQRSAFALGARDPSYATLLDWVKAAAGKPSRQPRSAWPQSTDPASAAEQSPDDPTPDEAPRRPVVRTARSEPETTAADAPQPAAPSRPVKPPPRDAYEPVDPFDPEIFNRQFSPSSPSAAGQEP